MTTTTTRQLVLLPRGGADWRLDDRTREVGRRGVAVAREILRLADEQAAREAAAEAAAAAAASRPTSPASPAA